MPPLETHDRRQDAVLWVANGTDDYGEAKVDAKVPLKVRWVEKQQETTDPQGNLILSDVVVVVDRVIPVNSIMWLGKEDDVADPPVDLHQVVRYNQTGDLKNRNIRRVVYLIRYSNELPVLA